MSPASPVDRSARLTGVSGRTAAAEVVGTGRSGSIGATAALMWQADISRFDRFLMHACGLPPETLSISQHEAKDLAKMMQQSGNKPGHVEL